MDWEKVVTIFYIAKNNKEALLIAYRNKILHFPLVFIIFIWSCATVNSVENVL